MGAWLGTWSIIVMCSTLYNTADAFIKLTVLYSFISSFFYKCTCTCNINTDPYCDIICTYVRVIINDVV